MEREDIIVLEEIEESAVGTQITCCWAILGPFRG